LTTSLGDFARIRRRETEIDAGLFVSLPFLKLISLFICELNWAFTLCLKEKVSDKMVPMGLVEGRNEPPSCFINTFQILDIVSLVTLNQFVKDVFLHSSE